MIASVFIPHGGCPERCTFCDQNVSGGVPAAPSEIARWVGQQLSTMEGQGHEIAFYGGTFTALSQRLQRGLLESVQPFLDSGKVEKIRIATRPDAVHREWMRELRDVFGVRVVELGVQSFDENVLRALGRTHTAADTANAAGILRDLGFELGFHLMVGCPHERFEDLKATVLKSSPDFVRIHPLVVIEGTELAAQFKRGEFSPLSLEESIIACADITRAFEARGIRVIRLGLQSNELLNANVIAGPWHPSFGDLVRSRICRETVDASLGETQGAIVELTVARNRVERVRGPKLENIQWWTRRHGLRSLSVHAGEHDGETGILRIRHASGTSERRQIELA